MPPRWMRCCSGPRTRPLAAEYAALREVFAALIEGIWGCAAALDALLQRPAHATVGCGVCGVA
ncbi:hypothetical protein C7E17_27020 [Stenotrophomonas maltophilia]|nr:hypothetical protein C7E17_27020 [Stenotrophomonas maltophilia]